MQEPQESGGTEGRGLGPALSWLRSLLAWISLALLLRWQVLEPRWIPSGSMLPSLRVNDRILVEKVSRRLGGSPPLGSVVVFRAADALLASGYGPDAALIKRVVAGPSDELAVEQGQLILNGVVCEEPWLEEAMAYSLPRFTVPDRQIFVLGDNRNASLDSHLWGPLPVDRVVGRAIWRYWPWKGFGPLPRRETCAGGGEIGSVVASVSKDVR